MERQIWEDILNNRTFLNLFHHKDHSYRVTVCECVSNISSDAFRLLEVRMLLFLANIGVHLSLLEKAADIFDDFDTSDGGG